MQNFSIFVRKYGDGMWLLGSLLLVGCPKNKMGESATSTIAEHSKDIERMYLKIDEVERRITQIEEVTRARSQDDIMNMTNMEQARMEMANLRGEMENLQYTIQRLQTTSASQSDDVQFRLQWLEDRADGLETTLGVPMPPPPTSSTTSNVNNASEQSTVTTTIPLEKQTVPENPKQENPTPSLEQVKQENTNTAPIETSPVVPPQEKTEKELFTLVEEHLVEGRAIAAEVMTKQIIEKYPTSKRIPEAYYRLAEASFNQEKYQEAAVRFQDVVTNYPTSSFAPWALLRQGECFDALKMPDQAKTFYQSVVEEYPKSKAAKEAKTKL